MGVAPVPYHQTRRFALNVGCLEFPFFCIFFFYQNQMFCVSSFLARYRPTCLPTRYPWVRQTGSVHEKPGLDSMILSAFRTILNAGKRNTRQHREDRTPDLTFTQCSQGITGPFLRAGLVDSMSQQSIHLAHLANHCCWFLPGLYSPDFPKK